MLEDQFSSNPYRFDFSFFLGGFLPESKRRPWNRQSCALINWASFTSSRIVNHTIFCRFQSRPDIHKLMPNPKDTRGLNLRAVLLSIWCAECDMRGCPVGCGLTTRVSSCQIPSWKIDLFTFIRSVDHKGVTCYGLRGRGVESRSLMTSVETRDLSGKADRSRVNSNTKRVGKSRHVDVYYCCDSQWKEFRSLIETRSLQLHVCRLRRSSLWWVVRGTQRF